MQVNIHSLKILSLENVFLVLSTKILISNFQKTQLNLNKSRWYENVKACQDVCGKIQRKVVKLLPMKYEQHHSKCYLFYGVPNTERILKKYKM